MLPVNAAPVQQAPAQQPSEKPSRALDLSLRVAGAAFAALVIGAALTQIPGEFLLTAVVLLGFVVLTGLCLAAIANTDSPIICTTSYGPRPWTFYPQPIVLPPRVIGFPSYRPAPAPISSYRPAPAPISSYRPGPMPAPGIDPRPVREPVGTYRR